MRTTKKTAVIYVRVSSEQQVGNTSMGGQEHMGSQEEDCRARCKAEGWEVLRVFAEPGVGATTDDRPEFQKAVTYCEEREVDYLLIWDLSRFARSMLDHIVYWHRLKRAGTEVISVTEDISGDEDSQKIVRYVQMMVSELENDGRRKKCRRGMKTTAMRGGWNHKAPLGYLRARAPGGHPILVADPATAPIVLEMFRGFAEQRRTLSQTQAWLSEATGKEYHLQLIPRMLSHHVYAGIIQGPLTDGAPVKAAFDGIVPTDLFEAVQTMLRKRQHVPHTAMAGFDLRGHLKCHCGRMMVGSASRGRHGGRYRYYHCTCGARSPADRLETSFGEFLATVRVNAIPILSLVKVIAADVWAKETQTIRAQRGQAERALQRAEAKRERLLNLYLSGDIDQDAYKAKHAEIRDEMVSARQNLDAAQVDVVSVQDAVDTAVGYLTDLPSLWNALDQRRKQGLIRLVFGGPLQVDRAGAIHESSGVSAYGLLPHVRAIGVPQVTDGGGKVTILEPLFAIARDVRRITELLAA